MGYPANESEGWLREARNFHRAGLYYKAADLYKKYLAQEPEDVDAIADYASCHLGFQNYRKARKFAKNALAIEPEHLQAHKVLAFCEAGENRRKKALEACNAVIRLAPDSSETFKFKADVEMELGMAPAAEESIKMALRLDPEQDSLFRKLAYIQLTQGKTGDAEATAKIAISLDPASKESLTLLAQIQRYTGRIDQSVSTMLDSMRIDPNDIDNKTQLLNSKRSVFPPYRWGLNLFVRLAAINSTAFSIIGIVVMIGLRAIFSEYQRSNGTFAGLLLAGDIIIGFSLPLVLTQVIDTFLLRSPAYAILFSPTKRIATRIVVASIPIALILPFLLKAFALAGLSRWIILLFGTTLGAGFNTFGDSKRADYASCFLVTTSVAAGIIVTLLGGPAPHS